MATTARGHLVVGTLLTPLERTIELVDMVAYAGATWDWYRGHVDVAAARAQGFPAPFVDGQMLGAYLAQQALRDLSPGSRVVEMSFRLVGSVFAGQRVRITAEVSAIEEQRVTVSQQVQVDGRAVVADAWSIVELPAGRSGSPQVSADSTPSSDRRE